MNKILRIVSTLVVGIGLILLFVYLAFQSGTDKLQALNQPSYYTVQNYWYLLVSGCGCIAFSIISCFLAWNKKMDEKIEVLPNAVGVERTELLGWLSGSSLDTGAKPTTRRGKTSSTAAGTEEISGDASTILPRHIFAGSDKTAVRKAVRLAPNSAEATVLDGDGATVTDSTDAATVVDADEKTVPEFTRFDPDAMVIEDEEATESTQYTQSTVLTDGTMTVLDDDDDTVMDTH